MQTMNDKIFSNTRYPSSRFVCLDYFFYLSIVLRVFQAVYRQRVVELLNYGITEAPYLKVGDRRWKVAV